MSNKLTKEQLARIQAEHKAYKDMFDTLGHQLLTVGKHSFGYDKSGRIMLQVSESTTILLDNKGIWSLL